jgi:hypothetical protein
LKNLIDLQTAYVTQLTTEDKGKGDWVVYNEDKIELYRLPADWDEKTVMAVIHFARKFELEAFNRGIEFWKQRANSLFENERMMYKAQFEALKDENNRLAEKLDELI